MLNCQILNVKILITWEYGYMSKIKRIIKKTQTNKQKTQSVIRNDHTLWNNIRSLKNIARYIPWVYKGTDKLNKK